MRWTRPRSFGYNLVGIGGGSAGLGSAYIAAAAKARVAIIESDRLGGDCLNTGCIPSKALIHSAKVLKDAGEAQLLGLRGQLTADFPEVMARVRRGIHRGAPHDSAERYQGFGVEG